MHALNIENIVVDEANHRTYVVLASRVLSDGFRRDIPWQQFFEAGRWKNKLAVQCGIDSIPENYLLNRQGKIIGEDLFAPALKTEVTRALSQN